MSVNSNEEFKTQILSLDPTFPLNDKKLEVLHTFKNNFRNHSNYWLEAVITTPKLLRVKPEVLKTILFIFKAHGIYHDVAWKVISELPEITALTRSALETRCMNFVGFCTQFSLDKKSLLLSIPILLNMDPNNSAERFSELKSYFMKENINELIYNNPTVLIEEKFRLLNKIKFLYEVMHVHQDDIVQSPVLMYDLREIKNRYYFLHRAGLYKHPNPKGVDESLRSSPNISDIITTSVESFVKDVTGGCGLSVEDYNIFINLLMEEEEEEEENEAKEEDSSED